MQRGSKVALLALVSLLGVLVLVWPVNHHSAAYRSAQGYNQSMGTVITKGGAAVAIALTQGNAPTGTSSPAATGINVWQGSTKLAELAIPNMAALPVTVNGITVSAVNSDAFTANRFTSVTLAVANSSAATNGTGLIVNGANAFNSTGPFDLTGATAAAPTTSPTVATAAGAGQNKITISGTIPSGATITIVRQSTNATPTNNPNSPAWISVNNTANGDYFDTSAPNSPVYYYAYYQTSGGAGTCSTLSGPVTATASKASTNESGASNVASGTPSVALTAPSQLVVTAGDTVNTLRWTNPASLGGVNVYRRVAVSGAGTQNVWGLVVSLPASTTGTPSTVPTLYQDSGLTNGTTYDYYVTATP